jgi:glycosyltransferase involved in cell wall biosynthesis
MSDDKNTISFVIPSIGRKSLQKTLDSIEKWPGDEVIVVQHHPPSGTWGNLERKEGIAKAKADYIAFIDDDDYYVTGHRKIMELAIRENSGKPNLFRMRYPNGKILWESRRMTPGNIGSPMILVPNQKEMFYKFQFPGNTNMGDYYFAARWKFPKTIWREEIIALLGHNDGVPGATT